MKIRRSPEKKLDIISNSPSTFIENLTTGNVCGLADNELCIPHLDHLIIGARDDAGAVGRECHRCDPFCMAFKWTSSSGAGPRVPHSDCVTVRTRDDASAGVMPKGISFSAKGNIEYPHK